MLPLVCIDVDGTLVGPSGAPTAAVWAAADAAVSRGQHLALTTARGALGPTLEYAKRLDPDGWHVFHAGAALVHTGSGTVQAEAVADEVVEAAIRAAEQHGWTIELYAPSSYTVSDDSRLARDHAALLGVPLPTAALRSLRGPVVRAQFVVPHAAVARARAAMAGLAGLSTATSPVMEGVTFASVLPAGVNKATAIERIAASLGASMAEVMMVGDGHNDLEAIEAVGHGVAMGNAEPVVAASARHHVAAVTEDGLAQALELSARL